MIGRPVDARAHISVNPLNVDFGDYNGFNPSLRLTFLQLLSLFSILLLLFLVYGFRSLRLKLSSLGRLGDKEALATKILAKETEKQEVRQSSRTEKRGWWWIDAVVGTDEEERVPVDENSGYVDGARLARWSLQGHQQPHLHVQTTQNEHPIPLQIPRQPPPISMAKLIMSRHAHQPRRPRSPPITPNDQMSQSPVSHAARSHSRLCSQAEE